MKQPLEIGVRSLSEQASHRPFLDYELDPTLHQRAWVNRPKGPAPDVVAVGAMVITTGRTVHGSRRCERSLGRYGPRLAACPRSISDAVERLTGAVGINSAAPPGRAARPRAKKPMEALRLLKTPSVAARPDRHVRPIGLAHQHAPAPARPLEVEQDGPAAGEDVVIFRPARPSRSFFHVLVVDRADHARERGAELVAADEDPERVVRAAALDDAAVGVRCRRMSASLSRARTTSVSPPPRAWTTLMNPSRVTSQMAARFQGWPQPDALGGRVLD